MGMYVQSIPNLYTWKLHFPIAFKIHITSSDWICTFKLNIIIFLLTAWFNSKRAHLYTIIIAIVTLGTHVHTYYCLLTPIQTNLTRSFFVTTTPYQIFLLLWTPTKQFFMHTTHWLRLPLLFRNQVGTTMKKFQ